MHWNLIDAVMKCFARFAPIITSRLEISPRIEQLNAERERLRVPLCISCWLLAGGLAAWAPCVVCECVSCHRHWRLLLLQPKVKLFAYVIFNGAHAQLLAHSRLAHNSLAIRSLFFIHKNVRMST